MPTTMAVALRRLNELDDLRDLPLTRENLDAAMLSLTALVARIAEHQHAFQFGDAAGGAPAQYPYYCMSMNEEQLLADREALLRRMAESRPRESYDALNHLVAQIDWQLKCRHGHTTFPARPPFPGPTAISEALTGRVQ